MTRIEYKELFKFTKGLLLAQLFKKNTQLVFFDYHAMLQTAFETPLVSKAVCNAE